MIRGFSIKVFFGDEEQCMQPMIEVSFQNGETYYGDLLPTLDPTVSGDVAMMTRMKEEEFTVGWKNMVRNTMENIPVLIEDVSIQEFDDGVSIVGYENL